MLNKLLTRNISNQKELMVPKSVYKNGKFISPWGCESPGNSFIEMLKEDLVECDESESEVDKNNAKKCDLFSSKSSSQHRTHQSSSNQPYHYKTKAEQKTDRYIKNCILKSVKADMNKIRGTNNLQRDHITWIGHASCLIQTNGIYILTDPVCSTIVSPIPYFGPRRTSHTPFQVEDIPIDIVLLSHNHYDHLDISTATRVGNRALWIVPLKVKETLANIGITNCIELDWWENKTISLLPSHLYHTNNNSNINNNDKNICMTSSATHPTHNWLSKINNYLYPQELQRRKQSSNTAQVLITDTYQDILLRYNADELENIKSVTITGLPAKHWSARTIFDKNKTLWASFAITSHNKHITKETTNYFFAGDTGYCPYLFSNIGRLFSQQQSQSQQNKSFHLALLPIGAYKPRNTHKEVHCDPEEAIQIHRDLQTKKSLGIHWGVYNLAKDYGCEAAFELHRCRSLAGLTIQDFFTMAPGECLYIDEVGEQMGEEPVNDISYMYPQQLQRYLDLNPPLSVSLIAATTATPTTTTTILRPKNNNSPSPSTAPAAV